MIAKLCEICGEPMPEGETMFKFHGYSGPCPKPPLKKQTPTPAPAWHDEPICAGFWLNSINQRALMLGEMNYMVWRQTGARWYGPIPQDNKKGNAA